MKTIGGKILSINLSTQVKKKTGGTYPGWQIVYDNDGDVQTLAKHENTLKYAPSLSAVLKSLSAGDNFTAEMEKKGDFWEILSIAKAGEIPVEVAKPDTKERTVAAETPKKEYKTDKQWETAEERAQKQTYIIRQSVLAQAVALMAGNGGVNDILSVAEKFEDWVKRQAPEAEVE